MPKRKTDYDEEQRNKVAVRNDFVRAIHPDRMDLNTMKLFRLVISQCRKSDEELYSYDFKITDLANALEIDSSNIYRDTENMCLNMMQMVLKYGGGDVGQSWKMKHIFEECEYESKTGTLTIKLHEDMTDLVLRLGGSFTQIPISSVLMMKSKYAIRLYELICEKMRDRKPHGRVAIGIQLSVEEIRKATGTDTKKTYEKISNLKNKVVLPAMRDIENSTRYKGTAGDYSGWKIVVNDQKHGRRIVGFDLEIWNRNGYEIIEQCKREGRIPPRPKMSEDEDEQLEGQMTLTDYLAMDPGEGGR